jgi:hypothetical protein
MDKKQFEELGGDYTYRDHHLIPIVPNGGQDTKTRYQKHIDFITRLLHGEHRREFSPDQINHLEVERNAFYGMIDKLIAEEKEINRKYAEDRRNGIKGGSYRRPNKKSKRSKKSQKSRKSRKTKSRRH